MSRVALVVAVSRNGVIGRDGGLPWHVSSDLQRFKAITLDKPVIMGRKTWESLPRKPLPGRPNIVITRQRGYRAPGATVVADAAAALAAARAHDAEEIAVIGGGEIYEMFFNLADRIYLTEVDIAVQGDTRFPLIDAREWRQTASEMMEKGPKDDAPCMLRVLDRMRPH